MLRPKLRKQSTYSGKTTYKLLANNKQCWFQSYHLKQILMFEANFAGCATHRCCQLSKRLDLVNMLQNNAATRAVACPLKLFPMPCRPRKYKKHSGALRSSGRYDWEGAHMHCPLLFVCARVCCLCYVCECEYVSVSSVSCVM